MARAELTPANTLVISASKFQYPGQWTRKPSNNCPSGEYLFTMGSDRDAITVIEIPQAGEYHLWTRSRSYMTAAAIGTRRYQLIVNGTPVELESGRSTKEGWIWERVGKAKLSAGQNVLALHDTARFFGRCDLILLTTDNQDPNDIADVNALKPMIVNPVTVQGKSVQPVPALPVMKPGASEVAKLENEHVRLVFLQGQDAQGRPLIARQTFVRTGSEWKLVANTQAGEALHLIYSTTSKINVSDLHPAWMSKYSAEVFEVNGKTYEGGASGGDPFQSGEVSLLTPRKLRVLNPQTVEVAHEDDSGTQAVSKWEIMSGRRDVKCQTSVTVKQTGDYSLAFSAQEQVAPKQLEFVQIPPVLQFQRVPAEGFMVTSSATAHPIALMQAAPIKDQHVTHVVVADPKSLPFVWSQNNNAAYGFSLRNAQRGLQPVIFQPVLGLKTSRFEAGQTLQASWYVLSQPGTWDDAMEYVCNNILLVRDYRQPWKQSLTQAALNIMDLIKDDKASGWSPRLKGFTQIESQNTASQSSPLAVLEAAILTQDEVMYRERALPGIEFSLTRPIAHFAVNEPKSVPRYVSEENTKLTVPGKFFGTTYWQGLHDMLGRANPWIAEIALQPSGDVRWNRSYSAVPKWSELLGAYRLSPKPELLEQIKKEADLFLKKEVYGPQNAFSDYKLWFCNVHAYPYWWDLVELYELTQDRKYLDAAQIGGFHTIAALWSHPIPPSQNIEVHPGNTFGEHPLMWWKGNDKYRLGWPRKPGDMPKHETPAWLVSNVGLGIEQLTTYYDSQGNRGMQNILMSCWSPNLLRLYQATNRDIYQTYARNSIIGRFTNYPGYYVAGHTDAYLDPKYPYVGPDVTDIYFHHIPVHLGFTLDYIVAQAQGLSKNKIQFPWCKQQGYVWFTNRVYGFGTGTIFDDNAVALRLQPQAAQVGPESIDYLMGRSQNSFWLILMNQSNTPVTSNVKIDAKFTGITTDRPCQVYAANGTIAESKPFAPTMQQLVPARGLVALKFAAGPDATVGRKLPSVSNGHLQKDLGPAFGELHAFRIRSPFAKDSLYVVITGKPAPGVKATLVMENNSTIAPITLAVHPYEFSLYPWAMTEDMTFHLDLVDAQGKVTKTDSFTMPGTR